MKKFLIKLLCKKQRNSLKVILEDILAYEKLNKVLITNITCTSFASNDLYNLYLDLGGSQKDKIEGD